jgi:hypothetical protein
MPKIKIFQVVDISKSIIMILTNTEFGFLAKLTNSFSICVDLIQNSIGSFKLVTHESQSEFVYVFYLILK